MKALAELDALVSGVRAWRADPALFVRQMWGAKLEPFQAQALQQLASGDRVSIRSGHGIGKSTLDAWAVIWFLTTRYPAKVPVSAPTQHQLADVLVAELAAWWRRMPEQYRNLFDLTTERFYLREAPESCFAAFRTGSVANPEALQGFHADHLLFVLDEASGIPDIVFEVAEGALSTPSAKVLMTSNPTRTSGYFFDSHHKRRASWHVMRVSCADSSRVAPRYIEEMREAYGEESNVFRVRVLGEFPKAEDDVVIPLGLVEDAVSRTVAATPFKPVWGVDVARFGDDRTALAVRCGNSMPSPVIWWHGQDLMQTVGKVHDLYRDMLARERAGEENRCPSSILVDVIGIGAGVVDRLRELGLPVRGVNVGESAAGDSRFMRLRDQLWWRVREWLEERDSSMVEDPALIGELTSVKYKLTSSGKLQVEGKDEMKQRGLRSPDLADAWVLTFAGGLDRKREDWVRDRYRADNRPRKSWRAA